MSGQGRASTAHKSTHKIHAKLQFRKVLYKSWAELWGCSQYNIGLYKAKRVDKTQF